MPCASLNVSLKKLKEEAHGRSYLFVQKSNFGFGLIVVVFESSPRSLAFVSIIKALQLFREKVSAENDDTTNRITSPLANKRNPKSRLSSMITDALRCECSSFVLNCFALFLMLKIEQLRPMQDVMLRCYECYQFVP